MTLDAFIKRLTELRTDDDAGRLSVHVNASVAGVDCWVHDDMINVVVKSEIDSTEFVRIQGSKC